MECRCSYTAEIESAEAAEDYLRKYLLPERVPPEWSMTWKPSESDRWENLTVGGSVVRCRDCGRRWLESHAFGDRGTLQITLRRLPDTATDDYLDRSTILDRAEKVSEAQHALWRAFERSKRTGDPEDEERCKEAAKVLWLALAGLYSPDLDEIVERLRNGDPTAVEPAVVFLEADPWCFRSGYLKERLMRYLSRMSLPEAAQERLRDVITTAVGRGPRRELPMTRRLARAVASQQLVNNLGAMLENDDLIFTHDQVRFVLDGIVR